MSANTIDTALIKIDWCCRFSFSHAQLSQGYSLKMIRRGERRLVAATSVTKSHACAWSHTVNQALGIIQVDVTNCVKLLKVHYVSLCCPIVQNKCLRD